MSPERPRRWDTAAEYDWTGEESILFALVNQAVKGWRWLTGTVRGRWSARRRHRHPYG